MVVGSPLSRHTRSRNAPGVVTCVWSSALTEVIIPACTPRGKRVRSSGTRAGASARSVAPSSGSGSGGATRGSGKRASPQRAAERPASVAAEAVRNVRRCMAGGPWHGRGPEPCDSRGVSGVRL
jgi:hypothetical protein